MSYSLIINNLEISVKNLISYKKIVSDFNLTLHPGRKLGIVGESGSGKTLSMLALTRLLPSQIEVTGGSIFFNNRNKVFKFCWFIISNIINFMKFFIFFFNI